MANLSRPMTIELNRHLFVTSLVFFCLFNVLAFSVASAAPEFNFEIPDRVKFGKPFEAKLTLTESVSDLTVQIIDSHTNRTLMTKRWKKANPSKSYVVSGSLSKGRHRLSMKISANTAEGVNRLELPFEVTVVVPIEVVVSKKDLKPTTGTMAFVARSPISDVELVIFDQEGQVKQRKSQHFEGGDGSGRIEVTFDPIPPQEIFRLEAKISDEAGQWRAFKFVRWHADIPHEDVVFENGQWRILAEEAKKLDDAVNTLSSEVKKFRESVGRADVNFDVSLYVGGMTDTVGSATQNQRLSEQRARAIAAYFRSRGLKLPIFVAGFGEAGLKVGTADEVAEPRNRRAIYVLTSGTVPNLTPPSGKWQKY